MATKAMCSPFGDHLGDDGVTVTRVTWDTAPSAFIQRTKSCGLPLSSAAMNRIRSPLGDQRAFPPLMRKRFRDPSASMIHSDESQRSFILSTLRRV